MGRQKGFYAVDEDQRALLKFCEESGLLAVPYLTPLGSTPRPVPLAAFQPPADQRYFYLVPADAPPDSLRFKPMADGRLQRVDDYESPAFQYSPSRQRDDVLEAGRIYLFTNPHGSGFATTRRAYDRLARWLGRWIETDRFHYRVGPAAAEGVRARRLRLMSGAHELGLADEEG